MRWAHFKVHYTNKHLLTHEDQTLPNKWLFHNSKLLKDGDKIRGLRLRTNLYPTRALTNKQSTDPASRLCRRCGEKPETAFHICQECESVHLSRTERHNYVSRQVARLIRKRNPALTVREEPRFTTRKGVRLKPDSVIESDDQVMVIDLAIVWDANEGVLKHKARKKGAKYSILKDLFDPQKGFSSCGMVFVKRSTETREVANSQAIDNVLASARLWQLVQPSRHWTLAKRVYGAAGVVLKSQSAIAAFFEVGGTCVRTARNFEWHPSGCIRGDAK
ncbi:hypothetical protein MRX96_017578 [Rhipicephalus microplus]